MPEKELQLRPVKFGNFEVDLQSGELRRAGVKLKLSGQPFQLLTILLEHPGEVVTRAELQQRLWPDTFVDFDHNLNKSINKIREVLRDSAESPRFIETVPRRGYRFIAPVERGISAEQPIAIGPPSPPKTGPRPLYYGLALLGVVIASLGAIALWKILAPTPAAPRVVRFLQLTNDGQVKSGPLATDGSRVYFNEWLPGPRNLVVQVSVHGGEAVPLAVSLKQPRLLDITREGTELLLANQDDFFASSFWVQPVAGGSPRRIATFLASDAGFSADQAGVLLGKKGEVDAARLDGSGSHKLLTTAGFPSYFRFSPNATTLRFTDFDYPSKIETMMEAAADGTNLHPMFGGCCGEWTPDGRFFIFVDIHNNRNDFWALPAARSLWPPKQDVKPIQLTEGPLDFQFPLPSKDGRTIFAIGTSHRAEVVRYNANNHEFVPYLPGISPDSLSFSQDGQWVTYTSYPDDTLWRSKIDGTERLQLTFPPLQVFLPRWSPDGKEIAFSARLPGTTWNIYRIPTEGGTPQAILPGNESQMDAGWSPDGNSISFASSSVPNKPIYVIDLKSKRALTLPGSVGMISPHWSPDGRYIAAIKADPPQTLNVFDFSTQKWTEAYGQGIGYETWSHDGKYIYFESYVARDASFRILRFRLADRKIEEITNLNKVVRLADSEHAEYWFGIAPDDSPLAIRATSTQEVYALEMAWP